MKIKTVCELTGLSDRTVRYYTEEKLISPHYTENYLGRKTFDFSDMDVKNLKDIAVLRKFGFSIDEIRRIILTHWESITIICEVRQRKQKLIAEETAAMEALSRLDGKKPYTMAELAEGLAAPVVGKSLPPEDRLCRVERFLWMLLKRWPAIFLAGLPVLVLIAMLVFYFRSYAYPVFDGGKLYVAFLMLLPTICIFLAYRPSRKPLTERQETARKWVRGIVLVLCVLYIPVVSFSLFIGFCGGPSITTNPDNYLQLDAACPANEDPFFRELFPQDTLEVREYHYWFEESAFGEKYDICAQCSLPRAEFEEEVKRAEELFSPSDEERQAEKPFVNLVRQDDPFQVVTLQEGQYTCLIRYQRYDDRMPFSPLSHDYVVYIFAYDPATLQVRYILCASSQGGDPYYLEMDW